MRDLAASFDEVPRIERVGDIGHMQIETALGNERAAQDADGDHPEGHQQERSLERKGDAADDQEQDEQRDGACPAARLGVCTLAVEVGVEIADEMAHPRHGMAYHLAELVRIPGNELGQQGQKR